MWVDESATGDDPTGTTSGSEDMTITVDGETYSSEVNYDINEDGVSDTAVIERQDGSLQAFVDEDGDGDADAYIKLNAEGDAVARASFDEASGSWVATSPGEDTGASDTEASSGTMTADLPEGDVTVGQPTEDTNGDGVADTAVVEDDAGNTLMFTDVDGDGAADVLVVLSPSGESATYEHTGDGEWTQVAGDGSAPGPGPNANYAGPAANEQDAAANQSSEPGWGSGGNNDVMGVARIDPSTGQWISPN